MKSKVDKELENLLAYKKAMDNPIYVLNREISKLVAEQSRLIAERQKTCKHENVIETGYYTPTPYTNMPERRKCLDCMWEEDKSYSGKLKATPIRMIEDRQEFYNHRVRGKENWGPWA
jgi:hypothetical protein